jgi:membrane protease YdiL (CAAX protease family)
MRTQIITGKDNGDVYTISFLLSFGWMLFGPVLYLIPYIVLYSRINGISINDILDNPSFMNGSFFAQLLSYILPIALIAVVFRKVLKHDFKEFKKNGLLSIAFIIGGFFVMILLSGALATIYQLLGIEGDSTNQVIIENAINSKLRIVVFMLVVFGAPIFEELIFRKFLIGFCEEKLKLNRWIALLLSATIFALIHVVTDLGSLVFFFQYFGLALVLNFSYTLSKNNIFVPMGIHFLQNLLSFIVV